MDTSNLPDHIVYSAPVIEFVTVAAETCLLLEHTQETERPDFVTKSLSLLSLLYLKTSLLTIPERVFDDNPERFVSEEDYNDIKSQIEVLLGEHDSFLETFHPDMSLSDTPIAAFVSENLADIYQELKDFAANYQLIEPDIMNDALVVCLEAFRDHWGLKLLNCLRALHHLKYTGLLEEDVEEEMITKNARVDRNSFLNFLRDEQEDEMKLMI